MHDFLGNIGAGMVAMIIATATSMTGGITAGPGETAVTGDSYSSVQVTNVIKSNDSGGYSKTIIETNIDGKVETKTIEKKYEPGESIQEVIVATSSSGSSVIIDDAEVPRSVTEKVREFTHRLFLGSTSIATPLQGFEDLSGTIFVRLSNFFGNIFGFFSFR